MDGSYKRGKNNKQLNVLGGDLEPCVSDHDKNEIVTGFYRDNCCNTGPDDFGLHTVCCICLLYTSPSPRDGLLSRMPSSA